MAPAGLIPQNQRTKDEQREIARLGGLASGRKRLAKKRGRELVQAMLDAKETDPKVLDEVARSFGLTPNQVKKEVAMHGRQIDKAIRKADTKAYTAVNKLAGNLDPQDGEGATIQLIIGTEAAAAADKWSK